MQRAARCDPLVLWTRSSSQRGTTKGSFDGGIRVLWSQRLAGGGGMPYVDAALEGVKTKLADLKEQIGQGGGAGGGDAELTAPPAAVTEATTTPLDAEA